MFMLIGGFLLGAFLMWIMRDPNENDGGDWHITALTGHALYYGCSIMLYLLFLPEFQPLAGGAEYIIAYLPVLFFGIWLFDGFNDDPYNQKKND